MITIRIIDSPANTTGINTEDTAAFNSRFLGGFIDPDPSVSATPQSISIRDELTNWSMLLTGSFFDDGSGNLSESSTVSGIIIFGAGGFGLMSMEFPPITIGAVLGAVDTDITTLFGAQGITLFATNHNDVLGGDIGSDVLNGLLGDDIYFVGPGDTVVDTGGIDTVRSTVSWVLSGDLENLELLGDATSGTGNALSNMITGNEQVNMLHGEGGNDVLSGFAGNDTLDGGPGDDTLSGGEGNDTYLVDSSADVIFEGAGQGTDTALASSVYTLGANVENLLLTGVAPINGTGNALDNHIAGNAGANILTGGLGDDTYDVSAGDTVVENPGEGSDTVRSSISFSLVGTNLEHLTLTGGDAIDGTGNDGNNILLGNSVINTLTGGLGDDTYGVDNAADVVIENPGEGTDTVLSSISFSLVGTNVENLTLTGSDAINATGDAGNNILLGNSGINTLTGGLGDDTYGVDNAADGVVENPGAGTDTVRSSINYTLGADLENLTLAGVGSIHGTGNTVANALTGNANGNRLMGMGGNDTLDGGAGRDTAVYASARSSYAFVRSGLAFSSVNGPEGSDTLTSVENLQFSDGVLYGNFALANQKGFSDSGKSDLLLRHDTGLIAIWTMNGLTLGNSGPTSTSSLEAAWKIRGTGDFNGDGKSDILWRHDLGLIAVWNMNALTLLASGLTSTPTLEAAWRVNGTGDFNGDGQSDILWRHDSGLIAVWNMNGTTLLASGLTSTPTLEAAWKVSGTGDFNGDGQSDILWRHDSGLIAVWNMNGTTLLASGLTSTPILESAWKVAGTGDFNGDGRGDILWRHDTGLIAVWNMNGTTLENSGLTSIASRGLEWGVADTGDYNGDGRSDILWRDSTSGQMEMWMMNGTTVMSTGATSLSVDTSWKIAGQPGSIAMLAG